MRRAVRPVLGAAIAAAAVLVLLSVWTRVASSSRFCATCHRMDAAAAAAARSVHADVPCLACHRAPGAAGALQYLPALARELGSQLVGVGTAKGMLAAVPCVTCHSDASRSGKGHPGGTRSDCTSCHGSVAHPQLRAPPSSPHPDRYSQTHGRDAAGATAAASVVASGTCTRCHAQDFCTTCHFRTAYPHQAGWIDQHGKAEEQAGPQACTMCHGAPSFCKGCHGTEVPHRATWLAEHFRDLQDKSTAPCYVCHAKSDCTSCHTQHGVHREQDLYATKAQPA